MNFISSSWPNNNNSNNISPRSDDHDQVQEYGSYIKKKPSSSSSSVVKLFGFPVTGCDAIQMPANSTQTPVAVTMIRPCNNNIIHNDNHNYNNSKRISPSSSSISSRFKCEFCRQEFASSQALGGHQNAHRTERKLAKLKAQFQGPRLDPPPPPPPNYYHHYYSQIIAMSQSGLSDYYAGSGALPSCSSLPAEAAAEADDRLSPDDQYPSVPIGNEGIDDDDVDIDLQLRLAPSYT